MKYLLIAIGLTLGAGFNESHAQTGRTAPYTRDEIIQIITRSFCNITMSEPATQQAVNQLRLSPMQICQCTVTETSYAMASEPSAGAFVAHAIRSHQSRSSAYANASEEFAVNAFTAMFNSAKANCIRRMAGR